MIHKVDIIFIYSNYRCLFFESSSLSELKTYKVLDNPLFDFQQNLEYHTFSIFLWEYYIVVIGISFPVTELGFAYVYYYHAEVWQSHSMINCEAAYHYLVSNTEKWERFGYSPRKLIDSMYYALNGNLSTYW